MSSKPNQTKPTPNQHQTNTKPMDQDKLIAILLTKEEIFQLMIMCHDSSIYWGGHLLKASHDPDYYLSESGCKTVIENNKAVVDKIEAVYDALRSEEKEQQKIDESLKEA